jgi:hypothetical protein
VGDIDPWTFTANAGDSIVVSMGETTTTTLTPSFRIYGPDGALLGSSYGSVAAQVLLRATNSGAFLVVAGDDSSGWAGYGNYRLSLAKTGSAPVISPNDEGGPMTNGIVYLGTIDVGDIDPWTINAIAGESIIVRMGEVTSSSLTPVLRIYGPDGALLDFSYGAAAAEVTVRATNSGTFLVVAGDYSNGWAGSGNYRLTLAMTGSPLVIAPGSEGGGMTNGFGYIGSIDTGGLGTWSFTACDGVAIDLQVQELTGGTSFTPQLRLYAPDGTLLRNVYNASFIDAALTTPQLGSYTVVVSDDSNGLGGSGTYQLTGVGISPGLTLCDPLVQGASLVLRGAGGPPAGSYAILTTTNVALPMNQWTPFETNQFDALGTLRLTNGFSRSVPQEYFRLLQR